MKSQLKKLQKKARLALDKPEALIPSLQIFSPEKASLLLPQTASPAICMVLDGRIQLNGPDGITTYASGEYFISGITTPLKATVLQTGEKTAFLALAVELTPEEIISVMLDMDETALDGIFQGKPAGNEMPGLLNAILALLNIDAKKGEKTFLSRHFKRELIFWLLTGKQGAALVKNTFNIREAGSIYRINSWIKENYKAPFSVEELARQAGMSISGFHQKFRHAVGMGPIQCQKQLRLTEARRLMLDKAASVTDAALEVGYESLSQFIRDYRRLFGLPPQKDLQAIRDGFGIQEKTE